MSEQKESFFSEQFDVTVCIKRVWLYRKRIILVSLLFFFVGVVISFSISPVYRCEALITPKDTRSSSGLPILNQFGGIGSMMTAQLGLSGISLDKIEILLRGYDVSNRVISQYDVLPHVFAKKWYSKSKSKENVSNISISQCVMVLQKKYVKLKQDRQKNTLMVAIEATDPMFAYNLVNWYLEAVDDQMRETIKSGSMQNIDYLRKQLAQVNDPVLHDKLLAMIASEYERSMLVNSSSFDVLQKPILPEWPIWPKKTIIIFIAFISGLLLSIVGFLLYDILKISFAR